MQVIIDDRERRSPVVRRLVQTKDVRYTFARLAEGDYNVDGRLLFERKTDADFRLSLIDGRLFSQAKRLADGPLPAFLILETEPTGGHRAPGMPRPALEGALVALPVIFGVPVIRANGPDHTVRLMQFASRQIGRQIDGTVTRHGYRPKGLRKRRLFVLQGLPGVGPKRAETLLDALGSVEAVFTAHSKRLAELPHMGDVIAQAIRRIAGKDEDRNTPAGRTTGA